MLPLTFTTEEAKLFAENECVEEWVHLYLKTKGNNPPFSDGLKLQKRYWLGPMELPVDHLERCCGPEVGMEFHNDSESWEQRVSTLTHLLQNGWEAPPLIVQHVEGRLIVRDGNGRHEALKRLQHRECWVILWDSEPLDQFILSGALQADRIGLHD